MADEKWKCPFCGSDKLRIDTPYMDRVTHEKLKTFCCKMQEKNDTYVNKHFMRDSRPKLEDVSKL